MSHLTFMPQCHACLDGTSKPFPFSMAFQPIADVAARRIFAYEALVRGPEGQSALSVLSQVTDKNRYAFDQSCRIAAISTAVRLGLPQTGARLSLNFMPGAVYTPGACIRLTLETAHRCNFPADRLIFEITEDEQVLDKEHLRGVVEEYRRHGLRLALDDFGAGFSGLSRLADIPVDHLKLDISLVRNLHLRPTALMIVKGVVALAASLGQDVIAEGVETIDEYHAVRGCGIQLIQGFLLAKPEFERLPEVYWPEDTLWTPELAALTPLPPAPSLAAVAPL